MTTYALTTASYGSNYANLKVRILEVGTGLPAIVMASATSGILSSNGNAYLDSSGNLSVFLDSSKTFQVWNNLFVLTPSGSSLATEVQRTAAQLASTPTQADIGLGLGATFFLDTNPAVLYRISADKTQYSTVVGNNTATFLGIFSTTGALQTAFPAAANVGKIASVGGGAPYGSYISNGSAWTNFAT